MAQWPRIRLPEQETQEAQVPPRGWEGSREKEMATHSSLLAWSIPWTEGPDGLQSIVSLRVSTHAQPVTISSLGCLLEVREGKSKVSLKTSH